jgi:hypothetical protein
VWPYLFKLKQPPQMGCGSSFPIHPSPEGCAETDAPLPLRASDASSPNHRAEPPAIPHALMLVLSCLDDPGLRREFDAHADLTALAASAEDKDERRMSKDTRAGQLRPGVGAALSTLGARVGVVFPQRHQARGPWKNGPRPVLRHREVVAADELEC